MGARFNCRILTISHTKQKAFKCHRICILLAMNYFNDCCFFFKCAFFGLINLSILWHLYMCTNKYYVRRRRSSRIWLLINSIHEVCVFHVRILQSLMETNSENMRLHTKSFTIIGFIVYTYVHKYCNTLV